MNAPGRIHLIGGGRDEDALAPLIAAFVQDAARGRSDPPLITALLVGDPNDAETGERFRRLLTRAGARPRLHTVIEGTRLGTECIADAEGILIGGGLTPAYHSALAGIAHLVRASVAAGIPYLGFSAGAAVAAGRALIGGYLVDGVEVCDPEVGEDLEDVTVVAGLGLVPFSVDVHAAQWGTLARLSAAVSDGLVTSGVAIDEHTSVIVTVAGAATDRAVRGRGAAWNVARAESDDRDSSAGVRVRRCVAGERDLARTSTA